MTFVEQVANSTGWPDARQRRNAAAERNDLPARGKTATSEPRISSRRGRSLLSRFVEAEILPRLALATSRRDRRQGAEPPQCRRLTTDG